MSSGSRSSSGSSLGNGNAAAAAEAASWSKEENKRFEEALAYYGSGTPVPDLWHKVSRALGGRKTADEVRRHYEILEDDFDAIRSGRVPFPKYNTPEAWN